MKENVVLINTSEMGGNHEGGALGSRLLVRHWMEYLSTLGRKPISHLINEGQALSECELLSAARRASYGMLSEGLSVFAFTASHTTTAAMCAAARDYYEGERIGLLWVDAHADLLVPSTSHTGRLHGMGLALCLGRNDPGNIRWEKLQSAVDVDGPPVHVGLIGVRDIAEDERRFLTESGLEVATPVAIEHDPEGIAASLLGQLSDCGKLVVSFDIDVVDANVLPGTASPAWGGLGAVETALLLRRLLRDDRVIILEVTEYNCAFDTVRFGLHQILSILKFAWKRSSLSSD